MGELAGTGLLLPGFARIDTIAGMRADLAIASSRAFQEGQMKAVPGASDGIQDRALCIADRFDHFVLVVAFDLIEVVSTMFPGKRLGAAEAKEIGRADPSVVVHPFGVGGAGAADP
ncbi:hypothetical protein DMX07_03420 [Pseudomonas soli]|uniref:Uncharacterized protein n=1 Tax=Pseudomonas soli TaxID=1306993 RepID=A0A2V4I5F2_9PSED|nr:hypothetical protein DMX07_03420 [Pseudomonas soli]